MARFGYIPHDQDREDQKAEEKAALRAMRKEEVIYVEPDARFGTLNPNDPEFDSVEDFAEFLMDDDRETYTCHELQCVWSRAKGLRIQEIRAALTEYGLTLGQRPKEHAVRGFNDNPNTRYAGNPMCGGGGGGSIYGMAD